MEGNKQEKSKTLCLYCGKDIDKKSAFCEHCGQMQVPKDFTNVKYEENTNATICPNCGENIVKNASFCHNCGYNLKNDFKKETKNKNHSALGLAAAVICGVAIVLPLPVLVSFLMCLIAMIMAIIDLCIPNDTKHKADDVCAIIIGVIYCFMLFK